MVLKKEEYLKNKENLEEKFLNLAIFYLRKLQRSKETKTA